MDDNENRELSTDDFLTAIDNLAKANKQWRDYHTLKARQHLAAANVANIAHNHLTRIRPLIASGLQSGGIPSASIWGLLASGTISTSVATIAKASFNDIDPDESIYQTFGAAYSGVRFTEVAADLIGEASEFQIESPNVFDVTALDDASDEESYELQEQPAFTGIEALLQQFDPSLPVGFRGAWQVFNSRSEDKNRQAAHSMRETVKQMLTALAPNDEIKATGVQPRTNKLVDYGYDQRIQYIAKKYDLDSIEEQQLLELFGDLNGARKALVVFAHGQPGKPSDAETAAYLKLCDNAVTQLLLFMISHQKRNRGDS